MNYFTKTPKLKLDRDDSQLAAFKGDIMIALGRTEEKALLEGDGFNLVQQEPEPMNLIKNIMTSSGVFNLCEIIN